MTLTVVDAITAPAGPQAPQSTEQAQRLLQIFRHSNDAILVIDPHADRILEANPRAAELLGYELDELTRQVRISAVHPDEMPRLLDFSADVLTRGHGWTNELSCTCKDGQRVPAEISAAVVPFDGRTCVVAVVRDVSARRAAEEALRRSEQRLRAFVDHAGDGFLMIDADGRIVDVNPRGCQLLGYSAGDLIGLPLATLQVEPDAAALAALLAALEFDQPRLIEGRHRRQDGSSFPSEVSLCKFATPAAPRYIALLRDSTRRKAGEAAIARLAELGQFTAMITHQIRNPLATMMLCLDFFARQPLAAAAARRLELACAEANRLRRLLDEVLAYVGEPQCRPVAIQLGTFLAELQSRLTTLPVLAGCDLQLDGACVDFDLEADVDMLIQALTNLVVNACEATPAGEPVILASGVGPVPARPWVEVRNGGAPIPPAVCARIGSPFYTTKRHGTGLGVAYVRRVAAVHGWEFELTSSATTGTRARLWL